MEFSSPLTSLPRSSVRAAQRAAVVEVLTRVCEQLGRMQRGRGTRRACEEVAAVLRDWGRREKAKGNRRG